MGDEPHLFQIQELEERIRQLEEENARLKKQLLRAAQENGQGHMVDEDVKRQKTQMQPNDDVTTTTQPLADPQNMHPSYVGDLTPPQIERYSRQLLLQNGFGVAGQQQLLKSKVLIVGAGGIGSTVILYLAACGVGNLTIVDFDAVELSNLHRQVIHTTAKVGINKAASAKQAALALNPSVNIDIIAEPLTFSNALHIISTHDVVVDATDNPQTRYLVNDACVLLSNKPLVSGSAMGTEGQLSVYNYAGNVKHNNTQRGPCYRCLYPTPNVTEGSKSCSDNGVLGPVPGLIGVLQAVETIKILTGVGNVLSDKLLMYDALQCSFLRIKKPPKQANCPVCGIQPTITSMQASMEATQQARGPSCVAMTYATTLPADAIISVTDYARIRNNANNENEGHLLLDVRVKEQYDLCSLPGSVNIPLDKLPDRMDEISMLTNGGTKPIYCLCRRGIASAAATELLLKSQNCDDYSVKNIAGGLNAWRAKVDPSFPNY